MSRFQNPVKLPKAFMIALILLAVSFILIPIICRAIDPFWGNERFRKKYNYYQENRGKYNAVVFGSSRMEAHFNPKVFDNMLSEEGISTFNLAVSGAYLPETHYLFNQFIKDKKNHVDYIFFEITPVNSLESENAGIRQKIYWQNAEHLIFALKVILDSNMGDKVKLEKSGRYLKSYLLRIRAFSFIADKLLGTDRGDRYTKPILLTGKNMDGFVPVDLRLEYDDRVREFMEERHLSFLQNKKDILHQRVERAHAYELYNQEPCCRNKSFARLLNKMIERAKSHNIHLVFILPPRLGGYEWAHSLKYQLPENNLIDIVNPVKYPQLYQAEYSFDHAHLNEKGASIYTQLMAEKISKIYNTGRS